MAKGLKTSDWIVEHAGNEGTVACAEYLGRFHVDRNGVIRITWAQGPSWNAGDIQRAAYEACEAAIRPRA